MKNRKPNFARLLTGCFLLLSTLLTGALPSRAALRDEYRPVEQAVTRVMRAAEKVVARTPYQFDAGVCFGVAVVRRGDVIQTPYPLQKGVTYVIFGGGDNAAQNIDLELRDGKGKVLARDVAADAIPAVSYVPKYTGAHRLLLRLKKSKTATSFCSLIVMRRSGGYSLPVSTLRSLSQAGGQASPEINKIGNALRFHRVRNEWAIYGAVLKKGDSTVLNGLRFESGRHFLFGFGDERTKDLDLYLLDGANRRLAEATNGGATPFLLYQTNANQRYNLALANRQSSGAAFTFVLVFDVLEQGGATNTTTGGGATTGGGNRRGGAGAGDIVVYLDGRPLRFAGAGAMQVNGRVLVPLRGVFEALGAEVEYDAQRRIITASSEEDELKMQVGTRMAVINDEETVALDVAPQIYGGSVMVPLRFVAEVSGASVRWDASRRQVLITQNQSSGGADDD